MHSPTSASWTPTRYKPTFWCITAYAYEQMALYLSVGAPVINYITKNRGRQNLKICSNTHAQKAHLCSMNSLYAGAPAIINMIQFRESVQIIKVSGHQH